MLLSKLSRDPWGVTLYIKWVAESLALAKVLYKPKVIKESHDVVLYNDKLLCTY